MVMKIISGMISIAENSMVSEKKRGATKIKMSGTFKEPLRMVVNELRDDSNGIFKCDWVRS